MVLSRQRIAGSALGWCVACSTLLPHAQAQEQPRTPAPKRPTTAAGTEGAARESSEVGEGQARDRGESSTADTAKPIIVPPRAISELAVDYPASETEEASVVVELLVGVHGRVLEAKVVEGKQPFSDAAVAGAASWLFEPATRDGKPIPARIRVEVDFVPPVFEEIELPVPPAMEPSEQDSVKEPEPQTVEVLVKGERVVGVKSLGRAEVRQMPGAFGDPFRAIEALPGVTPIISGLPYFFIRGAPPGNVGYFFDAVQVPLLYHVGAGPGVIHPAFISSVDLYSGSYPVRFGRFAGGIVNGEAAEPESRFRGEANIRIVDSGAFLEIPFDEGRGSAMLAGRYSYTGLVLSLLSDDITLGYWDYQGRISYELTPRDRVSVFSFGSHDFLRAANEQGQEQNILDLTFHRLDTRYTRTLDSASELSLTLSLGQDRTGLGGDPDAPDEGDLASFTSRTIGLRTDYERRLSSDVLLRAGADGRLLRYSIDFNRPEDNDFDNDEEFGPFERQILPAPGFPPVVLDPLVESRLDESDQAFEARFLSRDDVLAGSWVDTVINLGAGVTLTPGFRLDVYDNGGVVSLAPEPRITARFDITNDVSLTHDVGIAHQPPSFAIPIPGLGGAASEGLQRAIQSSAGVETKLPHELTASATLFQNVVLNSTDIFGVTTLQASDRSSTALAGRTTAHTYGMELYLRRSLAARVGGFLSYTLSRSTRTVSRLGGVSSYDRTHVLNAALAFDLGRRWRLGLKGVVYSGIPGQVAYPEAAVSPPRTPWFYRLDSRLEKRWLIGTEGAWWALVLEMLNTTLNRETTFAGCYAYGCRNNAIGPVVLPSIGVEAAF